MASIAIRKFDDRLKNRLRIRAARRVHSMEQEARDILRVALSEESPEEPDLAEAIRRRFAKFGGVELDIPTRLAMREPPDFR